VFSAVSTSNTLGEEKDACTQGSFGVEGVSKGKIERSKAFTSEEEEILYIYYIKMSWAASGRR
jgi:hypothetical protein